MEFQPKPIDQATFEEELDKTTSRRRSRPKLTVVDIPLQYGPESTLTAHVTEDGEKTHLTSYSRLVGSETPQDKRLVRGTLGPGGSSFGPA